ncbi:MAG: patatin-like phospholipase family protein [Nitrospinota bacterium]
MKVGLALGGGAARGVAHTGVLIELEKAGIPIDIIAGTSIGAVIGGMYAINPNAEGVRAKLLGFFNSRDFQNLRVDFAQSTKNDERRGILRRLAQTMRKSIFFGISVTNISYMSEEALSKEIALLIPDIDFSDTKIPFSCGATDLNNNDVYYFSEGPMRRAIVASCSIPGIFPPVVYDGRHLIDGSWAVQNPVARAREMGADFVIAVHIDTEGEEELEMKNGLDVVLFGNRATRRALAKIQLQEADWVIRPNICDIHWADFGKAAECLDYGCKEAVDSIPGLKKKLRGKRIKRFFGLR